MNSGYSKTPLENKLDLKDGFKCILNEAPKHYIKWFKSLDLNLNLINDTNNKSIDFIHALCNTEESLKNVAKNLIPALKYNGMLWLSWPKGSSNIKTDLKREPIRAFFIANDLVDVKVAANDEDWSGLKFAYRLKNRKQ